MWKWAVVRLATLSALVLSVSPARAQSWPTNGLYQIISGDYIECCGIAGEFHYAVPYKQQTFVRLIVDGNIATMTFFGDDMTTVFSVLACPSGDRIYFDFPYGFVSSNQIFFHVDPGPPRTQNS